MSGFPPRPRRACGVPQEFCAAASKAAPMGWVVKQWRLDTLERLLAEATQAELASARAAAERDARRARRTADRTATAAERQLGELERIGDQLRTAVRDWRVWLRDAVVDPASAAPYDPAASPKLAASPDRVGAPAAAAPAAASPDLVAPAAAEARPADAASLAPEPPDPAVPPGPAASPRRRRPARASLHSSALTELFRATAPR